MTTLDKIKAEIRKMLDRERDFTSENAKAQALALVWVLELIDKYAEQEPTWIPVSERLPEAYGEYLITWTTSQSKRPFIAICEAEETSVFDHENYKFNVEWLLEDYIKAYPDVEVIAWMPLPEPYEKGGE